MSGAFQGAGGSLAAVSVEVPAEYGRLPPSARASFHALLADLAESFTYAAERNLDEFRELGWTVSIRRKFVELKRTEYSRYGFDFDVRMRGAACMRGDVPADVRCDGAGRAIAQDARDVRTAS